MEVVGPVRVRLVRAHADVVAVAVRALGRGARRERPSLATARLSHRTDRRDDGEREADAEHDIGVPGGGGATARGGGGAHDFR